MKGLDTASAKYFTFQSGSKFDHKIFRKGLVQECRKLVYLSFQAIRPFVWVTILCHPQYHSSEEINQHTWKEQYYFLDIRVHQSTEAHCPDSVLF
jgi:hypothetical protein